MAPRKRRQDAEFPPDALEEWYQIAIAPSLISTLVSTVTDAVIEEVTPSGTSGPSSGSTRLYPVVLFDCLRVKIRDEGVVKNKAVYLALGIHREGMKDVLGLWIEQTEGAAFWLRVMRELQSRGEGPPLPTPTPHEQSRPQIAWRAPRDDRLDDGGRDPSLAAPPIPPRRSPPLFSKFRCFLSSAVL
jgi:hypothetical protein